MKIYGPYTRKDGRKHITIISDDGSRITKSYPRYLYEKYHGVVLDPEITVDHIDEDFTNDDIANLQLLSRADNIRKSKKPIEWLPVSCFECGGKFLLEARRYRSNQLKQLKEGPFCTRSCAGKYNQRKRTYPLE